MNVLTPATSLEIFHKDYTLSHQDNLHELPAAPAVFAILAIVDNEPVNCRYVASATNLQEAVRGLFSNPVSEGMKTFMQGPWIKLLQYEVATENAAELTALQQQWEKKYDPKIEDNGEYPGYYD